MSRRPGYGAAAIGLVARRPDPADGRRALVEMTADGLATLEEDRRHRVGWLVDALEELSASERGLLRDATPILRRLAES